MLYAARRDDEVIVYRSAIVTDDSDLYRPVAEATEGLQLVHRLTVDDAGMFWREAELSVYAATCQAVPV